MADGNVAGFAGLQCQADSDELGSHFIQTGRLGIHGRNPALPDLSNPPMQRLFSLQALVAVPLERYIRALLDVLPRGSLILRRSFPFRDRRKLDAEIPGGALGQRPEFLLEQKVHQLVGGGAGDFEVARRNVDRNIAIKLDQLARDPDLIREIDQRLAPLRLLDFVGALQERFKIAVFIDELRGRFDADAGRTRHVVDGIPSESLHVDDAFRAHSELVANLFRSDLDVLSSIDHADPVAHQLHQILVGGQDRYPGAGIPGPDRKRCNDVVGFVSVQLHAMYVESGRRLFGGGKLRNQIVGRGRSVRFVFGKYLRAERCRRRIERDRRMRRAIIRLVGIDDVFEQHVAVEMHGAHRRAVASISIARGKTPLRLEESAEDVAEPVDKLQMMPFAEFRHTAAPAAAILLFASGRFFRLKNEPFVAIAALNPSHVLRDFVPDLRVSEHASVARYPRCADRFDFGRFVRHLQTLHRCDCPRAARRNLTAGGRNFKRAMPAISSRAVGGERPSINSSRRFHPVRRASKSAICK